MAQIVIVDDDLDMLDALVDLTSFLSQHECIGIASLDELQRRRAEVLSARLIILDINLGDQQPSGVDIHHWLRAQDFAGRIVFLTGHALEQPLVQKARHLETARVYSKPIALDDLQSLVQAP